MKDSNRALSGQNLADNFLKMKILWLLQQEKRFKEKQQTDNTGIRLKGLGGVLPLRCFFYQQPEYFCLQTSLPMSFTCCHQHKPYPKWNVQNQLLAQRPKSEVTVKNQILWVMVFCI